MSGPQENKRQMKEVEKEIIDHFSKIKSFCDSGISKITTPEESQITEDSVMEKISSVEELGLTIQDELEEIRDLLYELEDIQFS